MGRFMKYLLAMAVGAALAALFDPQRGKSRRARLRDQAAAEMRDARREVERRARYESGRLKGAAHEAMFDEQAPRTDEALLQKVRSEAVGPSGRSDLEIDVRGGTVTLRGDTDNEEVRALMNRIRSVEGVEDVRALSSSEP